MKRYAVVQRYNLTPGLVAAYLPGNYRVIWSGLWPAYPGGPEEPTAVIQGEDDRGYSLDRYVIPRLGSGLMACREIDLSHPVMELIPEVPFNLEDSDE